MSRTWAQYQWPEWVPAELRQQIEEFWSDRFHRGPDAWERSSNGEGSGYIVCPWPTFGEEVRVLCKHGTAVAIGRYVHAWNNMGRVVTPQGYVVVSSGRTRGTFTPLDCSCNEAELMPPRPTEAVAQLNTWGALCSVLSERQRQRHAEGWTPEHDDQHDNDDLARAAACYAKPQRSRGPWNADDTPEGWPWAAKWWKPTPDDRRRELVKAAALIVAEIERIDRQSERAARASGPAPASNADGEGSRP